MNKKHSLKGAENSVLKDHLFSRRDFLKISGSSGIFIFFPLGSFGDPAMQQRGRAYPTDFNAYLKIGDDGRVSLYCSKIEMGQGIYTSMAQMLAPLPRWQDMILSSSNGLLKKLAAVWETY